MRGLILSFVLFFTFIFSALGGFEGRNDDSLLGVYNRINCGTGVTCTGNNKGIFNVATVGSLINQVTATAVTITESQCGSTFINDGGVIIQMELPEASSVIGCRLHFLTTDATAFLVNPDDDDLILTWTATLGEAISNATIGNNVTLQAVDSINWVTVSGTGVYTNAN